MGSTKLLLLRKTIEMTGELQVKKKKKKHGKKKKQDTAEVQQATDQIACEVEDDTEGDCDMKLPKTCEDGTATFSSCSKTLFFAVILVSSGLAILSFSSNLSLNLDTFGQTDILAQYGKESFLPNWEGLELDFASVESLGEAISAFSFDSATASLPSLETVGDALEEYGNAILKSPESASDDQTDVVEESSRIDAEDSVKIVDEVSADEVARLAAEVEDDRLAAEEAAREIAFEEETARRIDADLEAERMAAEEEAARIYAQEEAARITAEDEAATIAAEEEEARIAAAEEAARIAAEEEAARITAEEEARIAAEEEAARIAAEEEAAKIAAAEEAARIVA